MGKIITEIINRFDGGMSEEHRVNADNKYALTKHFDTRYFSNKLTPYIGTAGKGGNYANDGSGLGICRFEYGVRSGTTATLFGYGIVSNPGDTKTQLYYWDGSNWQAQANAQTTAGSRVEKVFFYYKGFFYFYGGDDLKRVDATGAIPIDEAYQSIVFVTNVVQPLVHPNDDIAYFFVDNKVHKMNNTSWTSNTLVLPTDMIIMDACAYGNYIAIACTKNDSSKQSVVYLWDRDSSLTTLTAKYDCGNGDVLYLEDIEGYLTAVVQSGSYIFSKQLTVNAFAIKSFLFCDSSSSIITTVAGNQIQKIKLDDRLYFVGNLDRNYDDRFGVWSVDRYGRFNLEQTVYAATSYNGFFHDGAQWIYSITDADYSYKIRTTSISPTSNSSSVYETLLLGLASQTFKLVSVGVLTEPLGADMTVTLKYRLKDSGAWTTIFSNTEVNTSYHEAINIEATADALPQYNEIQFQITSSGGAVILGLQYKYEIIDSNPST